MSPPNDNDGKNGLGRTVRLLRIISVLTFIPSLGINIAHGVIFNTVLPALGLLPHAFSVGLALYDLGWWKKLRGHPQYSIILEDPEEGKLPLLRLFVVTLSDVILGVSLLVCIVVSYIFIASNRYYYGYDPAEAILGTWGTIPYFINL